ncbi:hypothetical protein FB45DRAFT_1118229 [Roridomyces roridus]|uniref:F-box domain-containing protein n=1 Tax=Roridomyces roridus TaxID=1738132 RepID=A0AAD7B6T9_9AGAR|nr:hypothetical protein FB45DRAFT_1118229 [Roridomyces roridus]
MSGNSKASLDLRVPDELWLEIFGTLRPLDVIPLHTVSRKLHRISRSLLFQRFHFHLYAVSHNSPPEPRYLLPDEAQVERTTERLRFWASPDIAPLVRQCTVFPWSSNSDDIEYTHCEEGERILATFFQLLSQFKNVRSVTFLDVTFCHAWLSSLAALQSLEQLHVSECSIDPNLDVSSASIVMKLATFHFYHSAFSSMLNPTHGANKWLSLLDVETLTHLSLAPERAPSALIGSAAPLSFPNVHTLHLSVQEWHEVVQLRRFPSIRSLEICAGRSAPVTTGIKPVVLSQLERYTGPAELLALLDPKTCPRYIDIRSLSGSSFFDMARNWGPAHRVTVLALELEHLEAGILPLVLDRWTSLVKLHLKIEHRQWSTPPGVTPYTEQTLLLDLGSASNPVRFPDSLTSLFITWYYELEESPIPVADVISAARTAVPLFVAANPNLKNFRLYMSQMKYAWGRADGTDSVVESDSDLQHCVWDHEMWYAMRELHDE